jgi:hypothetical protein
MTRVGIAVALSIAWAAPTGARQRLDRDDPVAQRVERKSAEEKAGR